MVCSFPWKAISMSALAIDFHAFIVCVTGVESDDFDISTLFC